MLVRVAIITFLLGIATFSEFMGLELVPERSLPFYYVIVLMTYGFSFFYLILLYRSKNIVANLYIQAACDTLLITYMVYVTGGTGSIYSVFYTLVIIYSVLFLGRKGGIIIASACSIFYGTLLDLEYYGVIVPFFAAVKDYPAHAGYVFSRIFTHILSFYLIAFLTSFVVEQEKKTRTMLAEKEDAFEQLDLLHRSIVESVNLGILTINLLQKVKSFNKAAQDITDYALADVENKSIFSLFPAFADMTTKKETWHSPVQNQFEMAFKTKKSRDLILGCSLSPLKNNRGERIGDILIIQDLTSIKKMEEDYERSRRMAFIGEMAAHLAHEIRNPLASISGSIQVLSRDLRLSEGDERLMRIILRGKEQLEGFMKDFLLLARPKLGAHEMIDIRATIDNVLDALKYVPDWHEGIEIRKSIAENALIYANQSEIRQVIWNLLLNALQAMPVQGVLNIETKRKIFKDSSDCLEIIVADNGCGIAQKDLKKIFEPFYTTREKGTGLGLAIVNRIVESNKGKIQILSEVGKGTMCILSLPLMGSDSVKQSLPSVGSGFI
jgi:two-component system sensor histidine kinase PilS (NtrC family)